MNKNKKNMQVVFKDDAELTIIRDKIQIKIQFNEKGGIDVYGNAPVTFHAPANDIALQPGGKAERQIGDQMEDGTIFAGISPDTHKPFYARPRDEPLLIKGKMAAEYAKNLEAHGKSAGTFRVPTVGELTMLFENRAKINNFNESNTRLGEGTGTIKYASKYWSSTAAGYYKGTRITINFFNGKQDRMIIDRYNVFCQLRLVRD